MANGEHKEVKQTEVEGAIEERKAEIAPQDQEPNKEQEPTRETAPEDRTIGGERGAEETVEGSVSKEGVTLPVAEEKPAELMAVERTLEDGLWYAYRDLPEAKRLQFRRAGELVAQDLHRQLSKKNVSAGKVNELLRKWLGLAKSSAVNPHALTMLAKKKTDDYLALHTKMREEVENAII